MTPIWGYSGNTASLLTNTMRFPLLTQSGHTELHCTCPLSGVKRTSYVCYDPKRTSWHDRAATLTVRHFA